MRVRYCRPCRGLHLHAPGVDPLRAAETVALLVVAIGVLAMAAKGFLLTLMGF